MDLWVIGAAAAAGYVAKHWQNTSRGRDGQSELSSEPPTQSCPFRRLSQRKKVVEDASTDGRKLSDERCSEFSKLDDTSEATVSTSSYGRSVGSSRNHEECNALSLSNLPPLLSTSESLKEHEDGNGNLESSDVVDDCEKPQVNKMDSFHSSGTERRSLRSKSSFSHFSKPLNSLESCMMAQLYKENERNEEYMLSALPSQSTTMMPLLLSDGNQIISRTSEDYISEKIGYDEIMLSEISGGIPPLPKTRTSDFPKKYSTGKCTRERLSNFLKMGSGTHFLLQNGTLLPSSLVEQTLDRKKICSLLLISVANSKNSTSRNNCHSIKNQREADKLQELLRQTENLVQDLQDELEMKDSLTVKELAYENYESQDTGENSLCNRAQNSPFSVRKVDNSTNIPSIESRNEKEEHSSDTMSKIEAELEAEFERLGLEISTSALQRRLSDPLELDPDFVADFAQGELRPDMVDGLADVQPESDEDASGNSTRASGNYAVSPRELTLRLQNVIQSRLEERVKELETALQNSQRKLQLMESEHKNARKMSSSELHFSLGEQSPGAEGNGDSGQPLVMNLSGEALDSNNEEYEVLTKINESEEDDSPPGFFQNDHHLALNPFDRTGQNHWTNAPFPHSAYDKEKPGKLNLNQLQILTKHGSGMQALFDDVTSEDESSDGDNEIQRQLIKQIVEKTRKGSPVVLNAQRLLFALDENEG